MATDKGTEIQIQTSKLEPAVVEFNYDQIAEHLNGVLNRYKGLVFDEKSVSDCKKTIAELRKGKKSLDTFRKETKKRLTKSITEFEDQCKELSGRFDEVIEPLTDQYDQFEHDRKERKRKQIQDIIDALIAEQGLNEKFAAQLVIPDEYYNKGKSIKAIKSELTAQAETLGIAQDKEDADREVIKTKVELANAKHGVELMEGSYVRLLEHESIDSIVEQINADAEVAKQITHEKEPPPVTKPSNTDEKYVETYEVTGTEEQLDALEKFLKDRDYEFSILD